MRTRSVITIATAAAGVIALALAAPALASSAGRTAGGAQGASALGAPSATPPAKSNKFAGYSYQGGGESTWTVAARIVVPTVKCTSGPERAIDPSVGVYNATGFSSAGVFVGCAKGKAHYFLTLVVAGTGHNFPTLAVRPGDTVALKVAQGHTSTAISAKDLSRKGVKKTLQGPGTPAGSGPWVGDSAWNKSGQLGVPNFGTLHFSNATLNGTPLGAAGAAVARFNRVNGTTTQISTSKIVSQDSFTTVFRHS